MKKILVIDDDKEIADCITGILGRDYEVSHAPNGLLGFEQSQKQHIDLILMDISMPFLSGYWYCRALKKKASTRNIPVIMVSGRGDEDSIKKAYSFGACAYLKKPFRAEELKELVEKKIS